MQDSYQQEFKKIFCLPSPLLHPYHWRIHYYLLFRKKGRKARKVIENLNKQKAFLRWRDGSSKSEPLEQIIRMKMKKSLMKNLGVKKTYSPSKLLSREGATIKQNLREIFKQEKIVKLNRIPCSVPLTQTLSTQSAHLLSPKIMD